MDALQRRVWETGVIPLSWAGSTLSMDYLNLGDALSPVMVALCTGLTVERTPFHSSGVRLGAVGTIGHAFDGGEVWLWGSGSSPYRNPSAPKDQRIAYARPAGMHLHAAATRGPLTRQFLGLDGDGVYGDPVWLLPRFYRPAVPKRHELGVILHLSELTDRALEPHPRPEYRRYERSAAFAEAVRLITPVTAIGIDALKLKIDEILSCKRIVSTSLHGMVIAESYGIPCLYFMPPGERQGLAQYRLTAEAGIDTRIVDLYRGLGKRSMPMYVQRRADPTDWAALIRSIDAAWMPIDFGGDDLLSALPIPAAPVAPPRDGTVFDLPLLRELTLQHDVDALNRADRTRHAQPRWYRDMAARLPLDAARRALSRVPGWPSSRSKAKPARRTHPIPADASDAAVRCLLEMNAGSLVARVAWAATTRANPMANLGDALSPVIVSVMSGLPIVRENFDSPRERIVAVGTIGHHQMAGTAHFWGTGFDARRDPNDSGKGQYAPPERLRIVPHALRGPMSAGLLRRNGLAVPDVFGDPVWFLPKIMPKSPPTTELGVIVHLTELNGSGLDAAVQERYVRYAVPAALRQSVKIIHTICEPTLAGLAAKVAEITSCRRIVSTSLHGLVIAETYGIPCAWFALQGEGPRLLNIAAPGATVDHRIQDFYLGAGRQRIATYGQDRLQPSDWEAILAWVEKGWEPLDYDARPMFEAFPLPRQVRYEATRWVASQNDILPIRF